MVAHHFHRLLRHQDDLDLLPADLDTEVAAQSAGQGLDGLGLTQNHTANLDCFSALPHLKTKTGIKQTRKQYESRN